MPIPSFESYRRENLCRQVTSLTCSLIVSLNLLIAGAQENLMKARDERVALMNEVSINSTRLMMFPD